MPEPILPEKTLETVLLNKIYGGDKEQLEADIEEVKANVTTPINRLNAIHKLVREKSQKAVASDKTVTGYFLQLYRRKDRQGQERGYSVYLAGAGTIPTEPNDINTIHFTESRDVPDPRKHGLSLTFGEPETWSGLTLMTNQITGQSWLSVQPGAKIGVSPAKKDDIGKSLWSLCEPPTRIADKQGIWWGYIGQVFQVNEFDAEGQRGEVLPILGDGGDANLSLAITDTIDTKTGNPGQRVINVRLRTESQLQTLLGDLFDPTTLLSQEALGEVRDALRGQPVILFGSGMTPQNPSLQRRASGQAIAAKMKRPTIKLSGGAGLVVPYLPD